MVSSGNESEDWMEDFYPQSPPEHELRNKYEKGTSFVIVPVKAIIFQ